MQKIIYKAETRGSYDYGWLKTNYSFSFNRYYNPERMNFGKLRVLNDDIVLPNMGFDTHPHDNMEIITIPLQGSLEHKDSTGTSGIISTGEVQIMSAGSGIFHSERNPSKDEVLSLFQIWIFPKLKNIEPRYAQKKFDLNDRINKLQLIVSPDKNSDTLWINQDAFLYISSLKENNSLDYQLNIPDNVLFVMVIDGEVEIDGDILKKRDAIGLSDFKQVNIKAQKDSDLLFIEIPS
ncbi:MAG: pirin family protein [Candidatus Kapabacteria bacterium]|nr:pirin family protein [Candidatus Kapabacteria bacterium]